jgi:uncharacterized protein YbaP (TraB family)
MIRSAALPVLLASLLLAAPSQAAESCPAPAQPPTPEQMAEGMKNAKDRGALWTITKDGRTSYLYGTIHIGRAEWVFPGPKLMTALMNTGALAVEVDLTAPGTQQEMMAAMAAAPALTLTDTDRARLAKLAEAECVPPGAFDAFHPIMQAITYSSLMGRRDGLYAEFAQEFMLIGFARAANRPVVGLESIGLQMDVLIPDDAATARTAFDESLKDLEAPDARSKMQYTAKSWERGDLEAMDTIEEACQCQPTAQQRDFYLALNDGRNPGLARRIAEEHAKGVPVLAAVGLLHMTGDKAIPKLLAEMGFEVTRVAY